MSHNAIYIIMAPILCYFYFIASLGIIIYLCKLIDSVSDKVANTEIYIDNINNALDDVDKKINALFTICKRQKRSND